MNFSDFRFTIEKHIPNATGGMFDAYINGEGQGLFEFQHKRICISYSNSEWLYSFRGVIGRGFSLTKAMSHEKTLYDYSAQRQAA